MRCIHTRELLDHRLGVESVRLSRAFESNAEYLDRPVDDGVGSVVEHLADDLPADTSVGAELDLDDGRDSILVEEEMVDRPSSATVYAST